VANDLPDPTVRQEQIVEVFRWRPAGLSSSADAVRRGSREYAEDRFGQLIDEAGRGPPQAAAHGDFGAPAARPLARQFLGAASSPSSQVSPNPLNLN
jgi:hypothetical protein